MRIHFLGTSHGIPEPNRRCSCAMVEIDGCYYFIDMGLMAIDDMVTNHQKVSNTKAIFITHMHGDHTNGLFSFADLISWVYTDAKTIFYLPQMEGASIIRDWIDLTGDTDNTFDFRPVESGVLYTDERLTVTAIRTQHCKFSYAYLLQAEGKNVLFTGDIKHPGDDFPQLDLPLDLVVCEGAHFPVIDYLPVFADMQIKQVCVNHYAPWNYPHILDLQKKLAPIPVQYANDRMTLDV